MARNTYSIKLVMYNFFFNNRGVRASLRARQLILGFTEHQTQWACKAPRGDRRVWWDLNPDEKKKNKFIQPLGQDPLAYNEYNEYIRLLIVR